MILDFFAKDESPSVQNLIREGLSMNGYESRGWYLDSLVRLLRNHGVMSYLQEFRSATYSNTKNSFVESEELNVLLKKGLQKIKTELFWQIPVMVSVAPNFRMNKENHLILLTGIEKNSDGSVSGLYFHDSNQPSYWPHQYTSIERFMTYWRRSAIFVNP
jgi:hypothetical protein